MSKKTELVSSYLKKIKPAWPVPEPLPDANLLEQGMFAVLRRGTSADKAKTALKNLKSNYPDWNELRIAQVQEISGYLKLGKKGSELARDVKTYLQEVFQNSHGLDLEFLRDDLVAGARFASELTFLGFATANYLLWLAADRTLPVSPEMVRVLDRLDLISRTASMRKARAAIEPIIPNGDVLTFATSIGEVASNWCHKKPVCHLCPLVDDCKFGMKTFKEWKVQQARLAAQRKKEEARREAQRQKDEARRLREEERERKRAEAEAKKKSKELERRRRIESNKRKAEEKKRAREDAQRKRAEAKQAAAKKKEAAAKQAAAKKASAKKSAAKKTAAKKKKRTTKTKGRKASSTKASAQRSRPARRKTVSKKKAMRSSASKSRKPSGRAKKKTTKKKATTTTKKKKTTRRR